MIDFSHLLVISTGFGLLGFIEPCSIGASLLFLHYIEGKSPATKIGQVIVFALTRALFMGVLGAIAALIGAVFVQFQKSGGVLLGTLYIVLGILLITGRSNALMGSLGPSFGRLSGVRGTVALAVLFGLNIPPCAAPLLVALLAAAAAGSAGFQQAGAGFVSLGLFGLALSLPIALAVLWSPARDFLSRASLVAQRVPVVIGLVLVALGLASIYFALFLIGAP